MAERLYLIEPDGTTHELTDASNVDVLYGITGRGMPPIELAEVAAPGRPGVVIHDVRIGARDIDLPIDIVGADPVDLRAQWRAINAWFDPTKGDALFRSVNDDGTQREVVVRLKSFDVTEDERLLGNYLRGLLVLRAADPFWQSVNESSAIFLLNNTTATFFPLFPLRLTSSTIFADTTITNNGDAEAWPTWVIWGPGDTPVITNLTTGKRLALGLTLGPGETLTIDTRPGVKTVTGSDGANHFPDLSTDSSHFSLPKGNSAIRVEMGSADTNSQVTLRFRERWLSP